MIQCSGNSGKYLTIIGCILRMSIEQGIMKVVKK